MLGLDDAVCLAAARAFAGDVMALLAPQPLPPPPRGSGAADAIWWLAGLTVLADWVGSARAWFQFEPASIGLARYWTEFAQPRAACAIRAAGLLPALPRAVVELADLVGAAATPSPVQALAQTLKLAEGAPALVLIEDQTGSGKTEAALLLAHRMMTLGLADGLFVALPTMATANAMYDRLASAYRHLFSADSAPSLVLSHGRSRDNAGFQDTILDAAAVPGPLGGDPGDETASAQCAAWLVDDRRRGFQAQICVGTIDQALMAVLPTRHAQLRLLGLHRKVLLIDEAHGYDPYMAEELCRLVAFQTGMGGSTIILSATLPQATRQRLVAAFSPDLPTQAEAYPLVTVAQGGALHERPCAGREGLAREVLVERLEGFDAALAEVARAADLGCAVAWIRNAVGDAAEAHAALAARGVAATLFHAQFAMGDRLAIEAEVVRRFGKHGTDRAGVVIATQILEQSLDVDFDLVVTDLAPMDLIIQRAGRLWRHRRKGRPLAEPRLLVLSPPPVESPAADWLGAELRRTGFVYPDHALLWRTARVLFAAGRIVAPGDVRRLMEAVHAPQDETPDGLQRREQVAQGRQSGERSIALQNLMPWQPAYDAGAGAWASDVHTPTRLGAERITLRLARWDGTNLRPWFDAADARRSWPLSEVQVGPWVADGVPEGDAALAAEIARVRAGWGRWEREVPILAMTESGGVWCGKVYKKELTVDITYSTVSGLVRHSPPKPDFRA